MHFSILCLFIFALINIKFRYKLELGPFFLNIDAYKIKKKQKLFVLFFFKRSHYRKKHPGDSCPCCKSSVYEKATPPVGQESTYQELNIIENQYH